MRSTADVLINDLHNKQDWLVGGSLVASIAAKVLTERHLRKSNDQKDSIISSSKLRSYLYVIGGATVIVALCKGGYARKLSVVPSGAAAGFFVSAIGCVATDIKDIWHATKNYCNGKQ